MRLPQSAMAAEQATTGIALLAVESKVTPGDLLRGLTALTDDAR